MAAHHIMVTCTPLHMNRGTELPSILTFAPSEVSVKLARMQIIVFAVHLPLFAHSERKDSGLIALTRRLI